MRAGQYDDIGLSSVLLDEALIDFGKHGLIGDGLAADKTSHCLALDEVARHVLLRRNQ